MPDVVNIDISMVQRTIESFILWYTLMAVHKPLILELKLWLTDINSSIHSLCVLMSMGQSPNTIIQNNSFIILVG